MINSVILTGRITANIELRKTDSGVSYVFFTLAVNRRFSNKNSENERQQTTDFVPCVAWRQTADLMEKYLKKGSLIGVEGRIQVYTQQKDGSYDTRTSVQVSNITFLESREQSQNRDNNYSYDDNSSKMTFSNESSFNQNEVTNSSNNNFSKSNNNNDEIDESDINLEELKF